MCGIAGVVGAERPALAGQMIAAIRHRGPDGTGQWAMNGQHIAVARLSIVDPAAGCDPVTDETGRISIAFNGEIYNHRELRADLIRRGHRFATATDTEVVVHLYEEEGTACVEQLRGMFAFAVCDRDRIFLARDRLGIKPLHYAYLESEQVFLFASEIKAILRAPEWKAELDVQALADAFVLGYPVGTRTYLTGISSLAAGHTMTVTRRDAIEIGPQVPYFDRTADPDDDMPFDAAQLALGEALADSVERHLAADVEVGLTLSGGLDSTVLALLARECSAARPITFTIADHDRHPDLVQAGLVARMIGAEHHPTVIRFADYLAAIPGFVTAEEQPSSMYGLPFYLLSRRIAGRVKACLHGEGADELFGGYREYLDRQHRIRAINGRLPLIRHLKVLPSEAALDIITRLTRAAGFDDYLAVILELNRGDALERLHLDLVDKSAMAAGVEMRVPYLDDRVFGLVRRLPARHLVRTDIGVQKYILRRLCLDRFGPGLIDVVLRGKLGVPSAGIRYLQMFDRLCDEVLPDDYLTRHEWAGWFGTKRELLLFDMFVDIFIEHRGDGSAVGDVVDYLRARADRGGAARLAATSAAIR